MRMLQKCISEYRVCAAVSCDLGTLHHEDEHHNRKYCVCNAGEERKPRSLRKREEQQACEHDGVYRAKRRSRG